jgi:asparagine synthase (glutamine-hydrolysing)
MCGICGVFDRSGRPIDVPLLRRMTHSMRHRGPDGDGLFYDVHVALGHRRLSIIDLEGGAQPMENEDGRLRVVFNGEIYNFVELREVLEAFGHEFKTHSDTEVILHAYEQWGKDCVRRFNGMFAFALWDASTQEVFIARDHLGIKPLYYAEVGTRVMFASEIKAILEDSACPREVDIQALGELFTFRYVPSPATLFKGIRKLPPGHRMTVSRRGIEVERFWTSLPRVHDDLREEALIERYQALLADAVRLQLRSDVPLGLFLSSGIDSGVLLAIMSEQSATPIRAFTIGFEGGEKTNEVDDARALAQMFGAAHEFMMVSPEDYTKYYERYLWDLEEPVGNETAAAFYFVSRLAQPSVKVALAGQGADEPWAGYDRYLGAKLSTVYSRLPSVVSATVANVMTRVPGRFERLKRGASALGEPDVLTRFAKMYSFFSAGMKRRLFREELKWELGEGDYREKEALRRLQADVDDRDPLTQILYIDTRASLPDDLLMVGDKMSMANSIESRVPFLDYRLVEFIEGLPPGLKLRKLTGKYLHKRAVEKWLPKEIVWRKKKGFANPIEHWFRHRMRPLIEELLLSSDAAVSRFFDQAYIQSMLERDREGTEQFRRHIYLLLSFELWHRTFIKR